MQNQNTLEFDDKANRIDGELLSSDGPPAMDINVISGWKTSSGQMTAVFTVVCLLLSAFGYTKLTPDKLTTVYDAVMNIITVAGPVIAGALSLINFTNSRGKIASNAIWATSATTQAHSLASAGPGGLFGKIITGVGKGIDIAKIFGPTLPPNVGKILDTSSRVFDGIQGQPLRMLTDADITSALKSLSDNDVALNNKLDQILATLRK